jgi:putative tryptophan/tyrosine transport system substrate-binding protein
MRRPVLIALALWTSLMAAGAQEAPSRVAFLAVGEHLRAIRSEVVAELRRQGFIEGQNLQIEERVGPSERLQAFSRELAAFKPAVVVAIGVAALAPAVEAFGEKTPIVAWFGSDPVALGYAASTARPGGNITGFVGLAGDLDGKRLEILSEALPEARRFGALALSPKRHPVSIAAMQDVAARKELILEIVYAEREESYPAAFGALKARGVQGLVIAGSREFRQDAPALLELAQKNGFSTACEWAQMAREGCLLG